MKMAVSSKVSYDIIVSALDGDDDALGYIIACYFPTIRAKIREYAFWLSKESQEDCFQDICIGLMKEIREGSFKIQ